MFFPNKHGRWFHAAAFLMFGRDNHWNCSHTLRLEALPLFSVVPSHYLWSFIKMQDIHTYCLSSGPQLNHILELTKRQIMLVLLIFIDRQNMFVCFRWGWDLNSRFHICEAGTLPLEPHLQSIFIWLFQRWGLLNYLPGLATNLNPRSSQPQLPKDYRCEPPAPDTDKIYFWRYLQVMMHNTVKLECFRMYTEHVVLLWKLK
jgi:hypothetical protein